MFVPNRNEKKTSKKNKNHFFSRNYQDVTRGKFFSLQLVQLSYENVYSSASVFTEYRNTILQRVIQFTSVCSKGSLKNLWNLEIRSNKYNLFLKDCSDWSNFIIQNDSHCNHKHKEIVNAVTYLQLLFKCSFLYLIKFSPVRVDSGIQAHYQVSYRADFIFCPQDFSFVLYLRNKAQDKVSLNGSEICRAQVLHRYSCIACVAVLCRKPVVQFLHGLVFIPSCHLTHVVSYMR